MPRFNIAKLLDLNIELNVQEALLDEVLEGLQKQPHSNPAFEKAGLYEYFYQHHSQLKSVHTSSSSKEATSTAVISKTAFQEIQDGAATVSGTVKVEHVAHAKLKGALKICKVTLRSMDSSASDSKKLSAALKAKAHKSGDAELAAMQSKRAAEVDLASSTFNVFHDEFLAFVAGADLLDDTTSDDVLSERAAEAASFTKKAGEHLDCSKRIKATIKP